MKIKALFTAAYFGGLVIVSGCGGNNDSGSQEAQEHHQEVVNGDIRELTASVSELPAFLDEKHENIQNIYALVPKYQHVLESMPCYCGCGDSVGHKNNYDCFIQENNEDGSIVWDDHGTKCGVCLEIAAASMKMSADGKSLLETRQTIDEQYKTGYANPTPTPMPEA
ncbi:PCYCGC motif-containing (lipo)protein [Bacillus taeanensis]|uniref:Lipoprotein n=1 Tax=Bacillus taeanensis TaxID=273032 RepID=A0A366XUR9_9BACI|nr:PCYCGC motif-containing (lipo)protein [Bacillus taeanensis]RBW69318.1 hypothetical protein DS031_11815 [Bacillus taeanensis]